MLNQLWRLDISKYLDSCIPEILLPIAWLYRIVPPGYIPPIPTYQLSSTGKIKQPQLSRLLALARDENDLEQSSSPRPRSCCHLSSRRRPFWLDGSRLVRPPSIAPRAPAGPLKTSRSSPAMRWAKTERLPSHL